MKPLKIDNLPHDIVTGEFRFEYEIIFIDASAPEQYNADRLFMLTHMRHGTISVKYERIGPEPISSENYEIIAMLRNIESALNDALNPNAKEATIENTLHP